MSKKRKKKYKKPDLNKAARDFYSIFRNIERVVGKTVIVRGYEYIYLPDSMASMYNGWVATHRHVMSEHLRRRLNKKEVVHHKNYNKRDNRLENLELVGEQQHNNIHNEYLIRGYLKRRIPAAKPREQYRKLNKKFKRIKGKTEDNGKKQVIIVRKKDGKECRKYLIK